MSNIKNYKTFESDQNNDPYNEEKWDGELPIYNGNAIEFLENLNDENTKDIKFLLDKMLSSDDLDERMDLADDIITNLEFYTSYLNDFPQLEDNIKDLAIA